MNLTEQLCDTCHGLLEKHKVMKGAKGWTCLKCQKVKSKARYKAVHK